MLGSIEIMGPSDLRGCEEEVICESKDFDVGDSDHCSDSGAVYSH